MATLVGVKLIQSLENDTSHKLGPTITQLTIIQTNTDIYNTLFEHKRAKYPIAIAFLSKFIWHLNCQINFGIGASIVYQTYWLLFDFIYTVRINFYRNRIVVSNPTICYFFRYVGTTYII